MTWHFRSTICMIVLALAATVAEPVLAAPKDCDSLPNHQALKQALTEAVAGASAGGFGQPECIHTADQTQLPPVRP